MASGSDYYHDKYMMCYNKELNRLHVILIDKTDEDKRNTLMGYNDLLGINPDGMDVYMKPGGFDYYSKNVDKWIDKAAKEYAAEWELFRDNYEKFKYSGGEKPIKPNLKLLRGAANKLLYYARGNI